MSVVPDALGPGELAERFGPLERVTLLADLDRRPPDRLELTPGEMLELVTCARELLAGYYVHLSLKRALYAVDPLAELDVLARRLGHADSGFGAAPPEDGFHRELLGIFASLRDLHTTYTLPEPYRGQIAFLPFLVERCTVGRRVVFALTKTCGTFPADPNFVPGPADGDEPGVVITHWNGVPIARAVAVHAERTGGSNDAARRARGVERLTFRWMGRLPRPDEDWVVVTYRAAGEIRHLRFPWLVAERPPSVPRSPAADRSLVRGVDEEGEWIRHVKRTLFARAPTPAGVPAGDLLAYRELPGQDGRRFGHLRLYSFGMAPAAVPGYVRRVRGLLARAPADGLVIDIRGNPGGDIVAAERLLQLISPVPIRPLALDFPNTPQAGALAGTLFRDPRAAAAFNRVREEVAATAAPFLPSLPLESPAVYNDLGQVYAGPVVLLVDALSYSAADVFAAGFQDHRLGTVVGSDPQTGGGGGNVWPYESIRRLGGRGLPATLPGGASFDVAVRRTTRVAGRAGVTLEDRGVLVEQPPIALTFADALGTNHELLHAALGALPDPPRPVRLRATYRRASRSFILRAGGLARVDVVVDGRPLPSVLDPDGARVRLPPGDEPLQARFTGYAGLREDDPPSVSCRWRARSGRSG